MGRSVSEREGTVMSKKIISLFLIVIMAVVFLFPTSVMAEQEEVLLAEQESEEQEILIVTENGYGKRTVASEYRLQSRAGKGVKTLNVTEKNGKLVSLHTITNDEDLLITTSKGNVIRISSKNIPTTSRATQGVILIDMRNNKNSNQTISAVSIIPHSEDEEEDAAE